MMAGHLFPEGGKYSHHVGSCQLWSCGFQAPSSDDLFFCLLTLLLDLAAFYCGVSNEPRMNYNEHPFSLGETTNPQS